MPSNTEPLTPAALAEYEATRDLAADVLQAIREMKAGEGQVLWPPALAAREQTGLSPAQFATLLGVPVATLEAWEQGRDEPSGAARTLLAVARLNPRVIQDVAAELDRQP